MTAVWTCNRCRHEYSTPDADNKPLPRAFCVKQWCTCDCDTFTLSDVIETNNKQEQHNG